MDLSPGKLRRASSPTKVRRHSYYAFAQTNSRSDELDKLLHSASLTPYEKNLTERVFGAAEKLQRWCDEIASWGWSSSFDEEEEDADSFQKEDDHDSKSWHWRRYEDRLDEISAHLLALDTDDLKLRILRIHNFSSRRASHAFECVDSQAISMFNDHELFVTRMIMEVLPNLETLKTSLRAWSIRLAVLSTTGTFTRNLRESILLLDLVRSAFIHLREAWIVGQKQTDLLAKLMTSREDLEIRIAELGTTLDEMLDTLEGSDDTLPDIWIDRFEALERDYAVWAAQIEATLLDWRIRDNAERRSVVVAKGVVLAEDRGLEQTAIDKGCDDFKSFPTDTLLQEKSVALRSDVEDARIPIKPESRALDVDDSLLACGPDGRSNGDESGENCSTYNKRDSATALESSRYPDATFPSYSTEASEIARPMIGQSIITAARTPNAPYDGPIYIVNGVVNDPLSPHSPSDGETPGSPVPMIEESPSQRRSGPAASKAMPPLNSLIKKRRPAGLNDQAHSSPEKALTHLTPPPSPSPAERSLAANPALTFHESVVHTLSTSLAMGSPISPSKSSSSLLNNSSSPISGLSSPLSARTPHDRTPSLKRAFTPSPDSPPRPDGQLGSLTLTPADEGQARRRTGPSDAEIRVYHLNAPGKDRPVKLFIRRVGENNDRLLVRVGGGWADLGDYLKAYASHHLSMTGLDVKSYDNPQSPPAFMLANQDGRKRAVSVESSVSSIVTPTASDFGASVIESSRSRAVSEEPAFRASIDGKTEQSQTPTSVHSSVRRTTPKWTDTGNGIGLAGPAAFRRAKKNEISSEKQEWVDGIVEQARRTVSGTHTSPAAGKDHSTPGTNRVLSGSGGRTTPGPGERAPSRLGGMKRLSIDASSSEKIGGKTLWLRSKD